jgi:hypothetical protein
MVDAYNLCFFLYVFIVPAFLQYLVRAPSTFNSAPFYAVPLATLQGRVAYVNMSNPPQTMEEGVNHCKPCYEDQYHKMGMYQWDVMLRMSYEDLVQQSKDQPVTTMYPVLLASNDFKRWQVVADADDVAGEVDPKKGAQQELAHISPPLLAANLKPFGCVLNETGTTDPFQWFFATSGKANRYKWNLVEHISTHGSVNLVACVMQGFEKVNQVMSYYAQNCIDSKGKMQCEMTAREALGQCYALGSACGQACGFFSPNSQHCSGGGILDSSLFKGLTSKRVSIKTASGGGASNALVNCAEDGCKSGLSFQGMYVEANNPNDFVVQNAGKELADFYTLIFAMSDIEVEKKPATDAAGSPEAIQEGMRKKLMAKEGDVSADVENERRLNFAATKYTWHLAHMPNLTAGVFKDHSSNTMRIQPTKESCFTQPGFTYMVACMTAKPVFTSGNQFDIAGPPFNDRCLAVGGLCGAVCGSGQTLDDDAMKYCPGNHGASRRLSAEDLMDFNEEDSPYASHPIPMEHLVKPIEPRTSATTKSMAHWFFYHMFIIMVVVSYVATLLSKFPGNFSDFYPMHTWDEIKTHGYVLEKFGCATAFGVSAGEHKAIVLRNWIGRISARPEFDDSAFPTFKKWVDMFADEGHREGARLMWLAWTDFLDTSPPMEFIQEWGDNLREQSWDEVHSRSPVHLCWGSRRILPVVSGQATGFEGFGDKGSMRGGVELQEDSLAKLQDFAELYEKLPGNLKMEQCLSTKDDCVLTREVSLCLKHELAKKNKTASYTIEYSPDWKSKAQAKMKERAAALGSSSADQYGMQTVITDVKGQRVQLDDITDSMSASFPLHFREQRKRSHCKVIMVYVARARPETERKGIERTRGLDMYLWACLKPSAVRPYPGENSTRKQFRRRRVDGREFQPLNTEAPEQRRDNHSEVRKCVQDVVERQHAKFLEILGERGSLSTKGGTRGHRELAEDYLKYRVVDSDWELGRWCYGEIVGEDWDKDGDEVLILDNPSPALLELVSTIGGDKSKTGMGLVALESHEEQRCGCFFRNSVRVAYAAKPSLEFFFSLYDDDDDKPPSYSAREFERVFRKRLQEFVSPQSAGGLSKLTITQYQQGVDLTVELHGDGLLIEEIRGRVPSSVAVLNYEGRLMDNHPTVLVKKNLLMPYIGVRGKGGGLNYAVDLLQFRDGFVGTGVEQDPVPERMLFGIFDARHQPHPNFWQMVLPKFMHNTDVGFTYEVNKDIAMVQAPQHFAHLQAEDDVLDVLNGAAFNIMNVIRNRCGGVTSCGTNAVWQIDASDFSRQYDEAVNNEYFESRTKIEDTATTHQHFCRGKRSVYVQEQVCTGIAKVNADYLGAVQRWAEGAVQLFWVQLFVDRTWQLVAFCWAIVGYFALIFYLLWGSWTKDLLGYNLFCDVPGAPTLMLGADSPTCRGLYHFYAYFLGHNIDRVVYQLSEAQYMQMIDVTISWFAICFGMALITAFLAWRGVMPTLVRCFIMTENITYFWTSLAIFFWVALTVFMVISTTPPLMFNVSHFAIYVILIKIAENGMLQYYKSIGESNELAIWRGQQSYMISAPLYVMSIVQGTAAAWGITWRNTDKSFWSSNDHGSDVIKIATVWVTTLWGLTAFCVVFTVVMAFKFDMFHDMQDKFERQCQLCACWMMMLMALTVWEPFLKFWGLDEYLDNVSKDESSIFLRLAAGLHNWWRTRAWIARYLSDFGLPLLILSGATGGTGLLSVIVKAFHN